MSTPSDRRIAVRLAYRTWAIASGVIAVGAAVFALRAAFFGKVWGLSLLSGLALLGFAGWLLSWVRHEACGGCGAALASTLIRLPIEVADDLARAVENRGSLDPARPNHLALDGQAAYCVVVGVVCLRCRRTARVHVAKVGGVVHGAKSAISLSPLTTEHLLDEPSAAFLATLSRLL